MPPKPLVSRVAKAWPPEVWRPCHVLVAVSGGGDSVALLRVLHQLAAAHPGPGRLLAAHFNHRLRGKASDDDQTWVQQLCRSLDVPLTVGQADSDAPAANEEQARSARYDFLLQAAESLGARYIATGHTADDQVETVLMRVLRGSGLDGLRGIPSTRPLSATVTLVRPLLGIRRAEVETYLAALQQPYRHDATNREPQFTRNWIRGTLLPLVRDRFPGDVDTAVLRLAEQARDWTAALDQLTDRLVAEGVTVDRAAPARRVVLDRRLLAGNAAIVLQQVCRRAWQAAAWPEQAMGMTDWQRLAAAIASETDGSFTLPGRIDVRSTPEQVVLSRPSGTC